MMVYLVYIPCYYMKGKLMIRAIWYISFSCYKYILFSYFYLNNLTRIMQNIKEILEQNWFTVEDRKSWKIKLRRTQNLTHINLWDLHFMSHPFNIEDKDWNILKEWLCYRTDKKTS